MTVAMVETYRAFVKALGRGDVQAAAALVDVAAYRENCVGFTDGWVDGFYPALESFTKRVIPNLTPISQEELEIFGLADGAVARVRVTARHTGVLFERAATQKEIVYEAVDMVRVFGGRIVWRYLLADLEAILKGIGGPSLLGPQTSPRPTQR